MAEERKRSVKRCERSFDYLVHSFDNYAITLPTEIGLTHLVSGIIQKEKSKQNDEPLPTWDSDRSAAAVQTEQNTERLTNHSGIVIAFCNES